MKRVFVFLILVLCLCFILPAPCFCELPNDPEAVQDSASGDSHDDDKCDRDFPSPDPTSTSEDPVEQITNPCPTPTHTPTPSALVPNWKKIFHLAAKKTMSHGIIGSSLISPLTLKDITLPWSPTTQTETQNNIITVVNNIPNSLEIFQYLPGYAKFRGVLVSGEQGGVVLVGGSTEISGGVYTNGSVSLKDGAVITEDSYYLAGVIDHFLPVLPGVPSRLNILSHKPDSVIPPNPMNLRKLPKRAHIINTYEIPQSEAVLVGLP